MILEKKTKSTNKTDKLYAKARKWNNSFLLPKYWGLWFLLAFLWLCGKLPRKIWFNLGKMLGRLCICFIPDRQKIVKTNLKLCFPDLNEKQQKSILIDNFKISGIALLEPGLVWFSSSSRFKKFYRIEGLDNLDKAKESGSSILFCGLHMMCLEVMGRILGDDLPINMVNTVYRPNNNPLFEFISSLRRSKYSKTRMVSHKHIKDLIYFMKKKQHGCIIPDHDLGRKSSIFVPFMNKLAATAPIISFCAKKTNAKVLLIDYFFDKLSYQYVFRIGPALENFPTASAYNDTVRINLLIEQKVRDNPEQYLWMHRRFKTREKIDEPSFYS